jgi:hypothetical protein
MKPASDVGRARLVVLLRASAALLLAALGACRSQPPRVEDLAYPVLVLFERSGTVRHDAVADLRSMAVQRVLGSESPPWLIDSRLDIYRLERLESVHGGLWLMANPSARTQVRFDLVRVARADAVQARGLIVERDPTLRAGNDPVRRLRIEEAATLATMLVALQK